MLKYRINGDMMKLGVKKIIMCSTVMASIISILSVNALALKMTSYGVKEYNGVLNDQAFSWTGADVKCTVDAKVVNSSNWANIVSRREYDGHVQTPQVTYKKANVMGMHLAESGSTTITNRSWP